MTFSVAAGPHERYMAPVSIDVDSGLPSAEPEESLWVVDEEGVQYPVQLEELVQGGRRLTWIVPRLRSGQVRRFELQKGNPSGVTHPGVRLVDRPDQGVDIYLGDELFTTYQYSSQWARPFLYPLMNSAGVSVTRHFPIKQDIPGEKHDHPHHKSVFFTHGDVNGVDNWTELKQHGTTRHQSIERLSGGPVYGDLWTRNLWLGPADEPLMEQQLNIRVYAASGHTRCFDVAMSFHATHGDVVFGDTKEGGLFSVRVASSMDASGTGRIETSTGAIGEKESWGRRASWCHYSGTVQAPGGPLLAGIGVLDHPSNPRYPTYWHVRNYGLMAANPFGLSYYYNDETRDGSLRLPAGESLTFRYRALIHEGDARDGHMAEHFATFAYPVKVSMG